MKRSFRQAGGGHCLRKLEVCRNETCSTVGPGHRVRGWDEIRHRIRTDRKPVIVRGAMERWPALSKWTIDYLNEKIGAHEIPEARYCLAKASIPEKLPGLQADFETPELIKKKRLLSINLWFGKEGIITPLHYDAGDNLLAQIKGLKEVILYSIDDLPNFYPNPMIDDWPSHMSQIELANPNLVKNSALAKAQPFECILQKGEMLFIPAGWWHRVRILELSLSVNFWWIAPWSFYLSGTGMHVAPLALQSACDLLRTLTSRSARFFCPKRSLMKRDTLSRREPSWQCDPRPGASVQSQS